MRRKINVETDEDKTNEEKYEKENKCGDRRV